ncbi:VWA domain-containing protein [Candidatus Poribacteria bacterium]|nr:VWA domain-containing protein [Candidatus Poribacteria bacterium]
MSKISIQTSLLRDNIVVTGETFTNYLLIKVIPSDVSVQAMPLNVSLVLDVSGSMYNEKRLEYVKQAAEHVVDMMSPNDIVSVIAFADRSKVVSEAKTAEGKDAIKQAIRNIEDVDAGSGTSMSLGMESGVAEVLKNLSEGRSNRVIVLTDGQTKGEEKCEQIAEKEAPAGVGFSAIGVGSDWNDVLLEKIAQIGHGKWHYVDAPEKALQIFQEEFGQLIATAFSNVILKLHLMKDIVVKRVRQVEPDYIEFTLNTSSERLVAVPLGSMQKDTPKWVVADIGLPKRTLGRYMILRLELIYDIPASNIFGESTDLIPVYVVYTDDRSQSYVNGEVARSIDQLQIEELTSKATIFLNQGDQSRATMLLQNAQNIANRTGDARKTQALNQTLSELGQSGQVSRKTMLHLKDQARRTGLLSPEEVGQLLKRET